MSRGYPARETLDALITQGIVRQRKALGLSQEELARKAGVREETLKQIEQGDCSPSTAVVDRIDRALRGAEREQATLIDKDRQAGRKRRKARAR